MSSRPTGRPQPVYLNLLPTRRFPRVIEPVEVGAPAEGTSPCSEADGPLPMKEDDPRRSPVAEPIFPGNDLSPNASWVG